MQSVAALFAQHVRRDGLRFAEADADGDNVLTFDEFLSMQPKTVRQEHSEEEVPPRGRRTLRGVEVEASVKEGFQRRPGVVTLRVRWWCPVESTTVRVASVVLYRYQCSYVLVHEPVL